ncbi:outer membrane protein assembly factor BamE [Polycyclovorans algicola]|uniref:outer membrane protein assembly factor BamE n=1 Tax=Polycyclovorans algicola TaxID=616992 RepID=UPI00069325CF|nr:outer membrane protein assembly factor BamE [Polycyclovorans algicola]
MRFWINSALATILLVSLTGCQLVYKLPTRQGNFIEQDKLDQLEVGMTPEQVRFLLGTPIAADPYDSNRWDYLGYYRAPRGAEAKRIVSLHFRDGQLARMDGLQAEGADAIIIDPSTVYGRPSGDEDDVEIPADRPETQRDPGRSSPTDPSSL